MQVLKKSCKEKILESSDSYYVWFWVGLDAFSKTNGIVKSKQLY